MKIGIFYGSSTGNTQYAAGKLEEMLSQQVSEDIDMFDIAEVDIDRLSQYDFLILGSSTWSDGMLQDDWDMVYSDLDELDLSGKKVAIFGLGDQFGFPDEFCSAIGILANKVIELGAELVGRTDLDDSYEFDSSQGVEDGQWMGLALDEDGQSEMTEERISGWVDQITSQMS
jgi:flavodoxin I